MKNIIYLTSLLMISACNTKSQNINLTGKIAICPPNNDTCVIYMNNDTLKIKLNAKYSGLVWLNTEDLFICTESHKSENGAPLKSDFVFIDTSGKFIKQAYESHVGEFVGTVYPSINDSLLLFTTWYKNKERVDDIFYSPITVNILDLKNNTIITKIENFCPRINFNILETPWSPTEDSFVYSISDSKKAIVEDENETTIWVKPEKGIYIYDINKGEHIKIIETGSHPIYSPNGSFIAYLKENAVWLYDTVTKENKQLYKSELYEQIKDIHWTPDGNYLFLTCPKNYLNKRMLFSYDEKLIRIEDGKSVNFNKINKGLSWYTWKKE